MNSAHPYRNCCHSGCYYDFSLILLSTWQFYKIYIYIFIFFLKLDPFPKKNKEYCDIPVKPFLQYRYILYDNSCIVIAYSTYHIATFFLVRTDVFWNIKIFFLEKKKKNCMMLWFMIHIVSLCFMVLLWPFCDYGVFEILGISSFCAPKKTKKHRFWTTEKLWQF